MPKNNILIVDDLPANLQFLSSVLVEKDYQVRPAINGQVALKIAQKTLPDLILLDIQMPGINGYEVCKQLKADDKTREIPVIFISALSEVFDKVKAFSVGGVDYITKPFQAEEVLARVNTHLTINKLQKRLIQQNKNLKQEITKRQLVEEELRKFSRAVEQSANIIVITDLNGNIEFVNPAFTKKTGYSYTEIIGQNPRILNSGMQDKALFRELWVTIKSGKIWNGELMNKCKNGELYWELVTISPIKNQLGQITNYVAIKEDITQRKQVREALQLAKETAEDANKVVMASIEYAKIIQSSLLPNMEQIKTYMPNSFFLWMPRDVVSGDMIYAEQINNGFIVAVIDCTGHGVPGAFMTMMVSTNLKRIIREQASHSPAEILQQLNFLVKTSLQQDTEYAKSDDGLDIAICLVQADILTFAGAKLPLYYIHNDKITVIKGNKQSLGYKKSDVNFAFTNHIIELESDVACYLSTDGFIDQLGGHKYFQFGRNRFKNLLLENYQRPFAEQSQILLQAFNEYKGEHDRQDDVTVVGFGVGTGL